MTYCECALILVACRPLLPYISCLPPTQDAMRGLAVLLSQPGLLSLEHNPRPIRRRIYSTHASDFCRTFPLSRSEGENPIDMTGTPPSMQPI